MQIASEELFAEGVVQVEGHAVAAHVMISLGPAVAESLVCSAELHNACSVRHISLMFTCSLTIDWLSGYVCVCLFTEDCVTPLVSLHLY